METVVMWKGRGAVVSAPKTLLRMCPGAILLPLDMVRNAEVRAFRAVVKNLAPVHWAKFWLAKKDKRAVQASTSVELPVLVKESAVSHRQAMKSFASTVSSARAAMKNKSRSKGRAVTGTVSWGHRTSATVKFTVVK